MKPTYSFYIAMIMALALIMGCAKSQTPAASTDNAATSTDGASGASGDKSAPTEKPVAEESIRIPAGTHIVVRLGNTLSSKESQAGDSFAGTVARSVVIDGKTVIREGARARGTVVDAKSMGHFKGGALLAVRLNTVDIHGTERTIQTAAVERSIKGKGKRSAGFIGGGAGLGALIGGLAGGGKGAAIGAAAGAGAGTAGAAYTGNKEVVMPAESAVTFRLTHSIEVK